MIALITILCVLVISVPLGIKGTVATRKARIERKAKLLGRDLTFDK